MAQKCKKKFPGKWSSSMDINKFLNGSKFL